MALSQRTQVTLATVSVFLVSLVGLFVYSLALTLRSDGAPVTAQEQVLPFTVELTADETTGSSGEQRVVDVSLLGSHQVLAADLRIVFDPGHFKIVEVNSEQGILGQATTAFDLEQGIIALSFKPGRAVTPAGRIVTFALELTEPGTARMQFSGATSEVTIVRRGLIENQRVADGAAIEFTISSP